MATSNNGAHVLVFPYPMPSHIMPLLDLTHQLATRGLTITILITPDNLHLLNPLLSTHPFIKTLVLPLPAHPSLPASAHNPPSTSSPVTMYSMHELHNPILQWFRTHPSPPVAILSDMFLWWTHHLASRLGIRRIMFSPCGIMAMSVTYSLRRHRLPPPERDGPDKQSVSVLGIPNSPVYPWWQLRFLYCPSYVEGDPVSEFMENGILANMTSWGLVFNALSELERVYLDFVIGEAGHDRVWAVGPLLPHDHHDGLSGSTDRSGPISNSEFDYNTFSWLDTCYDQTVLYVCFGSQVVLQNNQIEEIALGLEKSGAKFIWVVKEAPNGHVEGDYGMVPNGFEDRVVGRGLVIKSWVPQKRILSHRAVGAFLTHCGWNSVMDGLVAGVVLLAWPMQGDQFVNARLLVDELEVATRVCEGLQTVPDSDELARVIVESVGGNAIQRVRAMELRKAALDAIKENGSAYKDLDEMVKQICNHNLQGNKN